jgi:UDP-2-acetamido-3-amino-2,3-dideoxy-glucuronate N-acetyltransferase
VEGLELGPGVERRHDPEDVLADPQVKRVVIATPASTHFDLCRRALASGKDVFVEKPLALTVAEGTALVEQASAANLVLMVGHILQYHPAVLVLKEMLDRGELGRAEYIYSNRLNLGKLRTEENILWSFAPHDISVILALVGAKPTTVSAHGEAILQRSVCDVTLTSLEFPGDVKAHTFVSWLHPFKEQRLVVVGSEQMAVFEDSSASDKLTLYPHRVEWRNGRVPVAVKGERRVVPVPAEEPLMAECRHFLESCATRIPPRTDGQEGLDVLEVLAAAEESLRSGGRVVRCAMESDRREIRSPVMVGSAPSVAEPVARPEAPYVHPTAVVDPGAELGPHTKVWHWTHISRGVRIGRNCVFGQNVFVAEGVTVGDGCKVQNNVSLYKGVRLEQDVFCGPSCVFTNVLDPRAFIEKKSEFRDTVVRRGASIGANATVVCGHTLGEFCLVAAGAVVTKDVPAHALVAGVPARVVGWVCRCGARLVFQGSRATCRGCGDEYVRDEQGEVKALPTEVKS